MGLIVLGAALVTAWCALLLPMLFVAEAGAGLSPSERAMVAAPSLVGSALLVLGGRVALRSGQSPARPRDGVWRLVILAGLVTGLAAILTLFLPSQG